MRVMPYRSYWYYVLEPGRQGLNFIDIAFKYCRAFRINIDVLKLTKAAFQNSLKQRGVIGCSERLFCCIKIDRITIRVPGLPVNAGSKAGGFFFAVRLWVPVRV